MTACLIPGASTGTESGAQVRLASVESAPVPERSILVEALAVIPRHEDGVLGTVRGLPEGRDQPLARADVECDPGAHANSRDALARFWDWPH